MPNLLPKSSCTGCSACYNKCPLGCISMETDEFGFLYPHIDNNICVDCKLCESACPGLNDQHTLNAKAKFVWGGFSNDNDILLSSSSGGVFSELCNTFFAKHSNGVVCGAAFDSELQIVHDYAMTLDDCKRFRSSKYVQSQIGTIYKKVEKFLKNDIAVLFTGTPCQIAALKAYLNKDYSYLYTQAIVCHGVPSGKLWTDYITYLKKRYGNIARINFRSKKNGWENYCCEIILDNGDTVIDDYYLKAFGGNIALRPSCSHCKYKYPNYNADIVLGDFWHIDAIAPQIYNKHGVSMVIGMTEKGQIMFNSTRINMNGTFFKEEDLYKSQKGIGSSVPQSPKHDIFLEEITPDNFADYVKQETKVSIYRKARAFAAKYYRKAIGKIKIHINKRAYKRK